MVGSLDISDGTSRHLCVGADCVVISVDYRLAPEAKFPGAAEDCYAATKWVVENASSINVDPHGIAVGGDSAGGNLAAVVSLMARERGGPPLAFQLMVYPVTDRDFRTDSYQRNAEGYLLTRESMVWYWDQYLGEASDAVNPYAAPMQAKDLKGLPPALVITAEFDPLRDEGEAYAKRLEAAGVRTSCTRYDGMIHGFFGMPDMIDKGEEAITQASAALRIPPTPIIGSAPPSAVASLAITRLDSSFSGSPLNPPCSADVGSWPDAPGRLIVVFVAMTASNP